MTDTDCTAFLQATMPRLGLRWQGFRRVRRTVCKRLGRRLAELGLGGFGAYRAYLDAHPQEWARLDAVCRIPVSRFWRDRPVFDLLAGEVLPTLAAAARGAGRPAVRCWSAGCASGEEAYSLRIAWADGAAAAFPRIAVAILATDADPTMVARAAAARYPGGSLREVPAAWREQAFTRTAGLFHVRAALRRDVELCCQDLRDTVPAGPFDLVLCRNLAFTYFLPEVQRRVLAKLLAALRQGGVLVIGRKERLPDDAPGLSSWTPGLPVYRLSD